MTDEDYIWRIETVDEKGAYSGGLCRHGMDGHYYGRLTHPEPYDDDVAPKYDMIFGFDSVLSARRWFTSLHDLMDWEDMGAKLVVFRSADLCKISHGKSQVAFKCDGIPVKLPCADLHRLRIDDLVAKVERLFAERGDSKTQLASDDCVS